MGIIMNRVYSAVHSIRNIWYGIATLSSRTTIWSAAIEVFHDYPSHLIHGFPTDEIMTLINSYLPKLDIIVHMHNGYLQTLMSIGLPGLIGILAFCAYILFCSAKLLFALPSQNILISDKMLTLIPIVCMAMNIVESVIFYNVVATEILNIVFTLFSGYLIEKTYSITRIGPSF